MKVILLRKRSTGYSSNVYLVLGNWNRIDDINTLVDVGPDDFILHQIPEVPTGVGKVPVQQIVLTHNHFDHAAGMEKVKSAYSCGVSAFSPGNGVDRTLINGDQITMGDKAFEVIHVPEHSSDSICLYNSEEKILFSGDTPLQIRSSAETHSDIFHDFIKRMVKLELRCIYPGHGDPITDHVQEMLEESLRIVTMRN